MILNNQQEQLIQISRINLPGIVKNFMLELDEKS